MSLPLFHVARHGDTAWTKTGQHTGLTDIPLTPEGEKHAALLGERLRGRTISVVWTSPLQRASRTCELAGFGGVAKKDPDLVEWNYGDFEGKRTAEIHLIRPGWNLFRDGCPGGETIDQVSARADRVIARVRAVDGNVLVFSSGHFTRVMCARWLGLPASAGQFFFCSTASLGILGYEHSRDEPVIKLWNETQ